MSSAEQSSKATKNTAELGAMAPATDSSQSPEPTTGHEGANRDAANHGAGRSQSAIPESPTTSHLSGSTPAQAGGNVWQTVATDQSLLRRFRAGSQDAATTLYLRYAERLNRLASREVSTDLARRVDSDDIVQSVFRTFFRRAASGQYEIADREDLWKLLLVMALNKIRSSGSFHRAAKRSTAKTLSMDGELAAQEIPKHHQEAFQVLKMTVEEIVAELPEEHREIVWLRIEGQEFDEIVKRTGRAKRSVERILQSFRQRLISLLGIET